MDCSIVIVSWNNQKQIRRCLESVLNTRQSASFEIFVVDNASDDGTQEILASYGTAITAIINSQNMGFAYACNQALRQAKGEYVILLNPDTAITNNSLDGVIAFFKSHDDAGIMGPHIEFPDRSTQWSIRRFPDLLSHLIIMTKMHNFFSNAPAVRKYFEASFDYSKTSVVDQVMGAFFSFRRCLLSQIGLLDEKYFIWYEEVDFCKAALRRGWKTYYNPAITIMHEKGASFRQRKSLALQIIMSRSVLHYFHKNVGTLSYCILLPFVGLNIVLAGVQSLLGIRKTQRNL